MALREACLCMRQREPVLGALDEFSGGKPGFGFCELIGGARGSPGAFRDAHGVHELDVVEAELSGAPGPEP